MLNFKHSWALFIARNKEYYRDRGSLFWSFVVPPLIVATLALSFSQREDHIFTIGILSGELPAVLDQDFINTVHVDDKDKGLQKIRYQQLDMLWHITEEDIAHYWVNPESSKSAALKLLLKDFSAEETPLSGRAVRYVDWVIPGVLGMNMMFSALFGVGYVIVRYRKNGVMKRLQATPISPADFLLAQLMSRLVILLCVSTLVYVSCNLFLDFVMLGSYLNLYIIAIVGNLAMMSLSLVLASRASSEETANGLLNFVSFPMMILSGIWFSMESAPNWLQWVSQSLPLTHTVEAARAVMLEGASLHEITHELTILLSMTVVFTGLAAVLFRWREN